MKYLAGYLVHLWSTTIHKVWVALYLVRFCWTYRDGLTWRNVQELLWRAATHDLSKYRPSEAHYFALVIFDLWKTSYGSPEYQAELRRIKPAIDLHYRRNRHHPEHFVGGFQQMRAIDIVELTADWCASARRHQDGDIFKSIALNQVRFGYSDDTARTLAFRAKYMLRTESLQPLEKSTHVAHAPNP
jgi:hypothetical protein